MPGPGLAGQHAQPRPKGEVEPVDQDDIANGEAEQHAEGIMKHRNDISAVWLKPEVASPTVVDNYRSNRIIASERPTPRVVIALAVRRLLDQKARAGSLFGTHPGSVLIRAGVDLTAPALDVEPYAATGREVTANA